ncbi:MAG: hypothetical protein K0M67_21465 [Thiobacillus sp.]|nr:hypothetical protein [Thiobacillus sp.]
MRSVLKGFDPDLGRKIAEEDTGMVLGVRKNSKLQPVTGPKGEMPPGLDAQQQHEWENGWLNEEDL